MQGPRAGGPPGVEEGDAVPAVRGDPPGQQPGDADFEAGAEDAFAAMIADRTGRPAGDLAVRVEAGVLNTALRVGVEDWALRPDRSTGPSFAETVTRALRMIGEPGAAGGR